MNRNLRPGPAGMLAVASAVLTVAAMAGAGAGTATANRAGTVPVPLQARAVSFRASAGDAPGVGGQARLSALQSGVAVRPRGSDRYWPPVGTRVRWTVVRPIQDLIDQGRAASFANLGTIGNVDHLRKHGDHTPWSAGKLRGRVYAKDTKVPAGFEKWLLAKCRSNYNTLWIDFFNINGRQYDRTGRYLGPSADQHLHISVRRGYENTRVTLFRDFAAHR